MFTAAELNKIADVCVSPLSRQMRDAAVAGRYRLVYTFRYRTNADKKLADGTIAQLRADGFGVDKCNSDHDDFHHNLRVEINW